MVHPWETLCLELFEELAQFFPVACASDEFYYFPQVHSDVHDWRQWDRFSPDNVADIGEKLLHWEDALTGMMPDVSDEESKIDLVLILQMARTLREQLVEVRAWESQPSFYLMIACIGLAEAVSSKDPGALKQRAETLPTFIEQARENLKHIPELFRDTGLKMIKDTRSYFILLKRKSTELDKSLAALERFENHLMKVETRPDFRLPPELAARILKFHLGTAMDNKAIYQELDAEIEQMEQLLRDAFRGKTLSVRVPIVTRQHWSAMFEQIPLPLMEPEGLLSCYRHEVDRLAQHCLKNRFLSEALLKACPVKVAPVPDYLTAIRAASSYSIQPGHPPTGGTFYIINADKPQEARQNYQKEYRILSAHETYPGHHLLDVSRWGLKRPFRRMIERPLFYEGWACFAEEMMRITGYLKEPAEQLLLARRRLWRAIRGKVDMGLQTGVMDMDEAAHMIVKTGVSYERALQAVCKYPLNPGYQLCYTIGLRRFLSLFIKYGKEALSDFVHCILSQGEIDFKNLERELKRRVMDKKIRT